MQTFFYSPLSPSNVAERNNPVLLLLFILKEILKDPEALIDDIQPSFGPFGWMEKASSSQKLREYLSLLPLAFPQLAAPKLIMGTPFQELIPELEPLIFSCDTNENLLLFLIRHQKNLAVKQLLGRICPEGLEAVKEKIAVSFRKRGYHFTRWIQSPKT
jgi:hypothetical protein